MVAVARACGATVDVRLCTLHVESMLKAGTCLHYGLTAYHVQASADLLLPLTVKLRMPAPT